MQPNSQPNLIRLLLYKNIRDLSSVIRTSHFSKKSINPENDGHENKQIQ